MGKTAEKPEFAWLSDPEVFAVNTLPAHSDHQYFLNEAEARKMMKKMPGMMKNRGRRGSFPGFPF